MEGKRLLTSSLLLLGLALASAPADATVNIQCPGDVNGDAVPDPLINNQPNPSFDPNVRCKHLAAGDGYIVMGDGSPKYIFGFTDVTGLQAAQAVDAGIMGANFSAPTIEIDEGDKLYLNLTNVGMVNRPDLFDPHSVHYHGFPQAAAIFDGVPEASLAINPGSTFTYFYNVIDPGTYIYHCHVEATEHMQMGMLGNLYVRAAQNRLPDGTALGAFTHSTGYKYAYNDGDGSTYYDVEYPLQISSFDGVFHDASESVQPLPFALMRDNYGMINGRGYPDTINPGPLPAPAENGGKVSQNTSSLIQATQGQKILLRVSNVSVTRFFTLASLGVDMKVVGKDAKLLRGAGGENLYYGTNSVTLGGGETADVIIDTAGVQPGTYFLYTTNLHYLNNNEEDLGGIMTEIVVTQ